MQIATNDALNINSISGKKDRIKELDILRAIACLTVILTHCTALVISLPHEDGSLSVLLLTLLNRGSKFTVPLFVFISGLVLYYNYGDKEINYANFLYKRLKLTLVPYFLWTIGYYMYYVQVGNIQFRVIDLLKYLILGSMAYHLYFVLIIVQFYFLFGPVKNLIKKVANRYILVATFLLNLGFILIKNHYYDTGYFKYGDRFFIGYLFYFILGCFFAKNYQSLKKYMVIRPIPLIIGLLFLLTKVGLLTFQFMTGKVFLKIIDYNVSWYLFCCMDIVFCFWLGGSIKRFLGQKTMSRIDQVGAVSYYIYLAHPLAIYIISEKLILLNLSSLMAYFTLLILLVTSSVLFVTVGYVRLKKIISNESIKIYQGAFINK